MYNIGLIKRKIEKLPGFHTVGTVPKLNTKVIEIESQSIPQTYIHDRFTLLAW